MVRYLKKLKLLFVWLFFISTNCISVEADRLIIYPQYDEITAKGSLIEEINMAKTSIKMSAYQVKDPGITDALINCAKRGVKIDIILEESPYKHSFNQDNSKSNLVVKLLEAGVTIHGRPEYLKKKHPNGHYHARYFIVDNNRFVITTGNFDETTFDHCRDFAVTFNKNADEKLFSSLQDLFNLDTANKALCNIKSSSIIVGPQHGKRKFISFLKRAKKSIKLYQQFFNDPEIIEVLKTLIKRKGIKVDVLMMAYPTNYEKDPNQHAQDQLSQAGANVRLINTLYMHAKAIIIDDKEMIIGSGQLSPPSLNENRELSLKFKGPIVDKMVKIFKEDLNASLDLETGRKKALEEKKDWNTVRINNRQLKPSVCNQPKGEPLVRINPARPMP